MDIFLSKVIAEIHLHPQELVRLINILLYILVKTTYIYIIKYDACHKESERIDNIHFILLLLGGHMG